MSEPWFAPSDWWWNLPGPVLGSLAGLWGAACGVLIPRGKGKTYLWLSYWAFIVIAAIALAAGLTAMGTGQPYHVWYGFTLTGALLLVLFGGLGFMLRRQMRQVEERQMRAQEFDG